MKKKVFVWVVGFLFVAGGSSVLITKLKAQQPIGRIVAEIDNSARATISGSRPPLAAQAKDVGRVAPETMLHGMSIVFKHSPAQDSELQTLIAAQQNPSSPLYHQWLSPDEFAARFGMADSDLTKVEAWLQEQGFSVDSVARSRNRIAFSGTVSQIQAAFATELHYYSMNGNTHFAPASDLSIPAALAPVVQDVTNLSSFRPQPRVSRPTANFTSSQSGHTFLTPPDVATIYDIKPAYTAGFTGKGQTIAVVGQTSVSLTDIENFQSAAGLSVKDPTLVLVPSTGNVLESPGDESESNLDLEYSGGMAPGATILFVYVGDDLNSTVFDSIIYAVENDIAPIISDSYGLCEPALAPGEYSALNGILQQGAAQGQSIIVASGDSGSPDCEGVPGTQQTALAVDFPASSQWVTAMGGTEFLAADVCSASTCSTPPAAFWQTASGSDVLSSALSYIPEQVWNDDAPPSGGNPAFLASGGGGISILTARPSWQTSVPGIPSGTMRLVPDISVSGSPNNAGYLYCSSDPSLGVNGSCSHGFRDANSQNLTVAGGTSFGAPIFAGLVAVINQKQNSVGQGVVSPTLYQLASNATTYASAFHDIKTGNNNCSAAGSSVCAGSSLTQFSAGTGYDMASGLGSLDFNKLLGAWPPTTGSALTASRTTLSAATNAPAVGANDAITITVAPASGSGTPSGTVSVVASCASFPSGCSPSTSSLSLSSGSATYNFVASSAGAHVITVTYSGDSTFAASTQTLALGNQAFRLTSTNPTVTTGGSGSSTLTIAPQEGYTGSIAWTVSSSPTFTNGCFTLANASVTTSSPVTATLTISTSAAACGSAMITPAGGLARVASSKAPPAIPHRKMPLLALGGLLFAGIVVCRPGKPRGTAALLLLVALTISLPACGGGSSSSSNNQQGGGTGNVAPGTYTLTVVGTDTATSSISASTFVAVTVN